MDPTCVFNFFTFFERTLFKSNCIIFIFSWCATHTKIRIKLVVIVTAGSQKITLWGSQRTPLGILRVNTRLTCKNDCMFSNYCSNHLDTCLRKICEEVSIYLFIRYLFIYLCTYLFILVQMQVWWLSVLCSAVSRNDRDEKDDDRILRTQLLPAIQHPNIQAYWFCRTSVDLCLFKPQLAVNGTTSGQYNC